MDLRHVLPTMRLHNFAGEAEWMSMCDSIVPEIELIECISAQMVTFERLPEIGSIVVVKLHSKLIINRVKLVDYPSITFTSSANHIGVNCVMKSSKDQMLFIWPDDLKWQYLDKIRIKYGTYVGWVDAEGVLTELENGEPIGIRLFEYSYIFMKDPRPIYRLLSAKDKSERVSDDVKRVLMVAGHMKSDVVFCIFDYLHTRV